MSNFIAIHQGRIPYDASLCIQGNSEVIPSDFVLSINRSIPYIKLHPQQDGKFPLTIGLHEISNSKEMEFGMYRKFTTTGQSKD